MHDKLTESCTSTTTQKTTNIHSVTAMPATSKNVIFPGHNRLLTTGTDNPSF